MSFLRSAAPTLWMSGAALLGLALNSTSFAADHEFGREAALKQTAAMKVADGLEVTLFASEPDVVNPASMDIDAKGRIWVTEGANYRLFQKWGKLRPEGDRIVILEDQDHDGKSDKLTVFYQGHEINSALGICILGDRIIVSCSPNIFIFEDKNQDSIADGPPKKLFTGIGGVDHDHGAHAFQFGVDGKLYFNLGNDGRELKKADNSGFVVDEAGNEIRQHRKPYQQGLVFRCNLDGSQVETLGWNFRNNFEVTTDSFGTLWQSDNDDDGNNGVRINYVMQYGNYGYKDEVTGASWDQKRTGWETEIPERHWHLNDPGVVPNLLQTGAGSPTGICLYEGNLLPEIFRGQMIHCDAGPRVVRAYPVTPKGAGYQASMVNLITTEDSWFRPSDVVTAPDGSVYVSDWNDAGVGGHYMADQKLESMTGRILRLAPKGHKPTVPTQDYSTAAGAAKALQSPNLATRYLAWTALNRMGAAAKGELDALWQQNDSRIKSRALHLLARIPGRTEEYVNQGIGASDPNLRIVGLRLAQQLKLDLIPLIKKLSKDSDPQVRRECALMLRHHRSDEMPGLWATLASQYVGQDRWAVEALGIGADGRWDECVAAYLKLKPEASKTMAGRDILWRSRAKQTPGLLVKILTDSGTTETEKPRYLRALDFLSGPEKDAALLQLLSANVGK